jgi:hypothetical protein
MDNERIPNDPYRPVDDDFGRQARFDDELRFDPETRDPVSGAKVAMFAVAIAVVLGALFYGLNNTSVQQAQTSPPAQTAQTRPEAPAPAPPGMRDVTPHANTNTEPGMTTGQAPVRPQPTAPPNINRPQQGNQ